MQVKTYPMMATPEAIDLDRLRRAFGGYLKMASTLIPPQVGDPIRLDAANYGQELLNKEKLS